MPYSDVSWAYKDPMATNKLNQMVDNVPFVNRNGIAGCEIHVTGTSTVEIYPGEMELGGKWLVQSGTSILTVSSTASWEGFTGQNPLEATSTAMYLVAYNSAGTDFDVKFRMSGPAYSDTNSGTATGPLLYDTNTAGVWLRFIGAVLNSTAADAGDLRKYTQIGDTIWYDTPVLLTLSGSTAGWSTLECKPGMPALSKQGHFALYSVDGNANADAGIWIKPNGASGVTATIFGQGIGVGGDAGVHYIGGQRQCSTNATQQIQYRTQANDGTARIDLEGYVLQGR